MEIFTHPDNVKAIKKRLDSGEYDRGHLFPSFTLRANPMLERDKPTGRFVLPCGKVVERGGVVIEDRFVTYGPEDVEWLLMAGAIREEREILVIVMKDSPWRLQMWDFPMMTPTRNVMVLGSV